MHSPNAANVADRQDSSAALANTDLDSMRESYADDLRELLPAEAVLTTEQQLRPYESDGLTAIKQRPLLVVLPETIQQVQEIMRWAHAHGVPVVARGAGTGLSGGASPHPQGILMGLAKFNRILELDPLEGHAVVQPGVRNLAISEAAAPHWLYYAPAPS